MKFNFILYTKSNELRCQKKFYTIFNKFTISFCYKLLYYIKF